jgi:hypothetical protein
MMRACFARSSGAEVCAIIRKPTVSRPIARASPKCWMEMSASVQCVATRMMETPRSAAAVMSSLVPRPGSISAAMRAEVAVSTAARISCRSGVAENP